MNKVYKIIKNKNENAICFIIQTEGDMDFWWWEISQELWDRYKEKNTFGLPNDFVNDDENLSEGCSCGSFLTIEDTICDYLEIEIITL